MDCSKRDYRFDNLKGVLIILVVLGHVLEKLYSGSFLATNCVYSIIYSFHMPAFIFISGYFSKNNTKSDHYSYKLVKSLLIPFLMAHLLKWLIDSRSVDRLFYIESTLWYLLCLFLWRILAEHISKLRFSILLSFAVSILVGFSPADSFFAISRAVAFFPVFLIGYKISSSQTNKLIKIKKVIPVIILALLFAVVALSRIKGLPLNPVFSMNVPYAETKGLSVVNASMLRVAALSVGIIITACLLIIIPDKRSFFSSLGKNTMVIYLGHSFCLSLIRRVVSMISPAILTNELLVFIISLTLTVLICLIFNNKLIVKLYYGVIDRVAEIILVKSSLQQHGTNDLKSENDK